MNIEELKELLDEFLARWSKDKVLKMTLEDYVGINNPDTFCQWVETKTRKLGSAKGMTSIKFGIYERRNTDKQPKNYENDDKYSWLRGYGDNREQAFYEVKKDIIKIINFAENGKFAEINNILLPDLFKWKIAFLYSNERLIPIYRKDALLAIAESFGMKTDKSTVISDIQEIMISNKPSNIDVYSYMRNLFDKYGRGLDTDIIDDANNDADSEKSDKHTVRRRKATDKKNTDTQVRTVERSYIVTQRHNKLQEALKNKLIAQYGKEAVLLEENYVDVKLLQKDMIVFYEVKSSPYASDCIREALGQILSYTFNDIDNRKKRIVIVGQFMPNHNEIEFIKYIKKNLNIEFEYENIDIE